MEILDHILHASLPKPPTSPASWAQAHARSPWAGADAAIAGGFRSDRPAWAFASGYRAALDALFPTANRLCALCVTEAGGNHPRAIEARVQGGRLVGRKRYVFLGPLAERLFVLARSESELSGRPLLRIYPVSAEAEGVRIETGDPAPVLPELPHGALALNTVAPEPLGGDGWDRYTRPFRTVEDVHVVLAMLGWALRMARESHLPPDRIEALLPPVLALRQLASADPAAPATHRALAPCLAQARQCLSAVPLTRPAAAWWGRDQAILEIGAKARTRRLQRARGATPG